MSKTILTRARKPRLSLDLPMAALAAVAVGFVAFAMPEALFSQVVTASGLPTLLPAAEPPLGQTARLAVVGTGTLVTFILVWLVLRALSAPPKPRRVIIAEEEAPRLRRADSHPDAPSRPLLVAGAELGEPFADQEEPLALETRDDWEWEGPRFGPAETEMVADELVLDDIAEPDAFDAPRIALPEIAAHATIADLAARFEAGLVRRRQVRRGRDIAPSASPPGVSSGLSPVDSRLQSALDDLQRLAARPS